MATTPAGAARATGAGQPVRRLSDGKLGMTTDRPAVRSPRIPVIWVGAPYATYAQLDEIERIDLSGLDTSRWV